MANRAGEKRKRNPHDPPTAKGAGEAHVNLARPQKLKDWNYLRIKQT